MDTGRGKTNFDSASWLPDVHQFKWFKLHARLRDYPDTYSGLYNYCIAAGMSPEPANPHITQDAIAADWREGFRFRTLEVNGVQWRVEFLQTGSGSDEWIEIDGITTCYNLLLDWQRWNDHPTEITPADDDVWMARIGARSLRLMWSIVAWRQRLEAEGVSWKVAEA